MSARGAADRWDEHWAAYDAAARANPAQAYRRALVLELLALERGGGPARILELGCGQGELGKLLLAMRPNAELCGVDRSATAVELAAAAVGQRCVRADLEQPFELGGRPRGWATHAVCSEVLEHVADPVAVLVHAREWMAAGSRLVVTVPGGPISAFDRRIGHRGHFDLARLERVLVAAGYRPVLVTGAGFPFFNLYRLAVIAAGGRLAVAAEAPGFAARPATRAAAWLFGALFRRSLRRHRLGWQRIAVAVRP